MSILYLEEKLFNEFYLIVFVFRKIFDRGKAAKLLSVSISDNTDGQLIQLLGREKTYAIENPGYNKIWKVYESSGVPCRHVAMNKEGIDVRALEESGAQIAHISPTHHYPTGRSTIRISYMVLPPHLLNEFYERLGFYACTFSNFEQYTLARFIED